MTPQHPPIYCALCGARVRLNTDTHIHYKDTSGAWVVAHWRCRMHEQAKAQEAQKP